MKTILLTRTLAIITLLATLSACSDNTQVRLLNEQIRALEAAQNQSKQEMDRTRLQLKSLENERNKLKEERDKLEQQTQEAQKALEGLRKDFEAYRNQYKISIRKSAPGMQIAKLEIDGKTYENITVRELTEDLLTFHHQNGSAKAALSQLNAELQTRFGYDSSPKLDESISSAMKSQNMETVENAISKSQARLAILTKQQTDLRVSLRSHHPTSAEAASINGAIANIQLEMNLTDSDIRQLQIQRGKLIAAGQRSTIR
jgi:predicted  nucleic acid-binding Zn-ribbon protein